MIANINWKVITRTCIVPSTWTRQHLAQNIGAESFPTISTTFKLERSRSVKEVRVVAQGMTLWGEYDFSGREDMEIDLDLVIDERAELSWVCTVRLLFNLHSVYLHLADDNVHRLKDAYPFHFTVPPPANGSFHRTAITVNLIFLIPESNSYRPPISYIFFVTSTTLYMRSVTLPFGSSVCRRHT